MYDLIWVHSCHSFPLEVKDIPLMKKSHPSCRIFLQVIEFRLDCWVVALAPTIVSLFIKAFIECIREGKMPSFLPLHTSQTLLHSLDSKAKTARLLSRGIYLHYTLQGRHIFINSKVTFADAIPITLQACQPCKHLYHQHKKVKLKSRLQGRKLKICLLAFKLKIREAGGARTC